MKRAIVLASFGVSEEQARQNCLEALAIDIAAAHPDYDLVQAYTSSFIRKRLQKRKVYVPSLEECLEELGRKGYEQVLVQPSHLTPGEEYSNKILASVQEFQGRFSRLAAGEPLFFREGKDDGQDDYSLGLDALWKALEPAEEELVLLGHGSPHRHNPVYEILQERADAKGLPVHIGVLEESDTPSFSMVLERLKKRGRKSLLLAPLLLSGGIHVTEDLSGSGPNSWKSRLEGAGFSVRTSLKGLGEYPEIRALYVEKTNRLAKALLKVK